MKALPVLGLLLASSPALAGGLLISPAELPPDALSTLGAQVAAARAADPVAFRSVAQVYDAANALDEAKRGPVAPLSRALKPLGRAALMPMLELAALRVPEGRPLSEGAALSLQIGVLESLGALRDSRAAPVLWAAVRREGQAVEVTRAAAEAYGFLQTEEASERLLGLIGKGPELTATQRAVLEGAASCRVASMAAGIDALTLTREEDQRAQIRAFADLGNAWAWKTPGAIAKADERRVRQIAARRLLWLFARGTPALRQAASDALMAVDDPGTLSLISSLRKAERSEESHAALDALAARFARNPTR